MGELSWSQIKDPGHTQIRNFSCHAGGEEHIVGREISVNDGRTLAMEVVQTKSHFVKDGIANLLWENAI